MSEIADLELNLEDAPHDEAPPDTVDVASEPQPEKPPAWTGELVEALRRVGSQPREPQQQPPPAQMSREQLQALNDQMAIDITTKPMETLAPFVDSIVNQRIAQLRSEAEPLLNETAVEGFIERFKSRKREDDPLYKQTVKEFERDLADSPMAFSGRSLSERNREAELRWDAAKGRQLSKKVVVKPPESRPPGSSAGGGTTMGTANGATKVYEMTENEKRQLYRYLSKEEAEAEIARIESGEAGIA